MRNGGWVVAAAALMTGCGEPASSAPDAREMTEPRGSNEAAASPAAATAAGPERRILAFGDSLFAGYRLGRGQGYPERLQAALRARGINASVANAGVSGDTTAAGRQRFQFVLGSQPGPPDLAIVELGGNDLLRGIPPSEVRANLAAILDQLKAKNIPILLMGMRAPPNAGPEYQAQFDAIYPSLAKEYGAALVPFFQAPVYATPGLLQPDHVHPTAQGVEALVAGTVEAVVAALPEAER